MPSRSASPERETVLVGRLLRAHGIRGELKIEIHSDNPERFERGSELILVRPGRRPEKVRVARFRLTRGGGIIGLAGCETRDAAEELQGGRLEVARSDVPAAPPGFYYHYELVGCRCFGAEEGDLGEVIDLVEDGGGHLLRLERGEQEILVPFVEEFLVRVDVENARIDLRLPPGLVEICTSES